MKVHYRERALADIEDIYRYLVEPSPSGARNVLQAIHASIQSIAEQPYAYHRTDDPDIRVKLARPYRYRIFYMIVDEDAIEIIHVRHTSRRPQELR
jgi:toxin ParE1/3/4